MLLRPAEAEDDIGTVISFDCEAPEVEESLITPKGAKNISINPLNWKTDGTPADKSENLGACFTNYDAEIEREVKGLCGCYIDEKRGALKVTDVDAADYPAIIPGLPEGPVPIFHQTTQGTCPHVSLYNIIIGTETAGEKT